MTKRSCWAARLTPALAAAGLSACAGASAFGGGAIGGPPIQPDTSGVLRPFNDEPLAESITYGKTRAGNFHYRYFDRTTGAACVLEGHRGDVYVEYPTREQVRSTDTFAQAPETFAQPTALELQKGGSDLPVSIAAAPLRAFVPGGAADASAGSGLDVAIQFVGKTIRRVANIVLDPVFGVQKGISVAADPEVRVVTTYVRDGDLRCVLLMHSAQVADTRISVARPPPPPPEPAPEPVPEAVTPGAPAKPGKRPGR